jgi:RNA polymerase sigma factor (sigma-70 family)
MMTLVDDDVALYRRHADELIRYATALVGPTDAPDVVTDGVLAAFGSPGWGSVEHRRAYLYRSVLNRALTVRRSDERRQRRELAVALPAATPAHESSIDAHRALAQLSPQQRAVVYLTYWDDLTPMQIADLLGVGEGTVRKQLARAREQLRRILDER